MHYFLIVLLISIVAQPSYSNKPFSELMSTYLKIFNDDDPETVFMSRVTRFNDHEFNELATEILCDLTQDAQAFANYNSREFNSLFRGIIAYTRLNQNIFELIEGLPLDSFFEVFHQRLLNLFIKAKECFERDFSSTNVLGQEEFVDYVKLENDVVLAGDIIRFILSHSPEGQKKPEELKSLTSIVANHVEVASTRLRLMATKQLTLHPNSLAGISRDVNDKKSNFYHTGSRYNVAGKIILETLSSSEMMKLEAQ